MTNKFTRRDPPRWAPKNSRQLILMALLMMGFLVVTFYVLLTTFVGY